jgi:hypothetical protein
MGAIVASMTASLPSSQPDRAVLAGTVERVTFHNAGLVSGSAVARVTEPESVDPVVFGDGRRSDTLLITDPTHPRLRIHIAEREHMGSRCRRRENPIAHLRLRWNAVERGDLAEPLD